MSSNSKNNNLTVGLAIGTSKICAIAVEVDDIEAELKRLEELGAEVLEGPTRTATGLSIAFIQAPDDVRIEVMQLPH